jgi:hypothetical protein
VPDEVTVENEMRVPDWEVVAMEESSEEFPRAAEGIAEMVGDEETEETTPDTEEMKLAGAEGVADKLPSTEFGAGTRIIA